MKRTYTHIKVIEDQMIELRQSGKTRQEIADELGFTKQQIKNWINRHNKSQARLAAGLVPKRRGKSRESQPASEKEYKFEIKRLKMENELLRDFLQLTGRR